MFASIIIGAAVFGYCGFLIYRIIEGKKNGTGNPFSCTGQCQGCMGACAAPEQQEAVYREIKASMQHRAGD